VASKGEMREVARAYVEILANEPERLFERDDKLVADVRKILVRTDRTQSLLAQILTEVDTPDLDLKQLTDTRGAMKNDNRKVRGAFTRSAWDDYIRDRLYQPLGDMLGDEWVLGISEDEMQKDREKQLEELRSAYFDQYIGEWKQFINAIYVEQPDSYPSSLTTLEDLTHGEPASIKRLCVNLAVHTTLPPPEPEETEEAAAGALDVIEGEATKAVQKKGKAGRMAAEALRRKKAQDKKRSSASLLKDEYDVAAAFEGLVAFGYAEPPPAPENGPAPPAPSVPVDQYLDTLRDLRVALKGKLQNDTPEDTKALVGAVKAAGDTVDSLINDGDHKGWGAVLDKWLRPPIRSLESIARTGAGLDLTKAWCDEVVRPWNKLAKRYPFDTKGREVPLADFAAFYQPETGTVWKFYLSLLSARVPRRHDGYAIETKGAKVSNAINPKIADFLDRAQDVTTVMFPAGADGVMFEFDVQVQGARKNVGTVSVTELSIDGTRIQYKNGPFTWDSVTWPGDKPQQGHISARGFSTKGEVGPHEGDWGFFRLLEAGTATGDATKDTFKFEWDITDQDAGIITVLIRPKLDDTPIYGTRARGVEFMQVFRHPDLAPPRQIIVGGPACGGGGGGGGGGGE
jgi:type VI secretion system protein ImpL